MRVIIREGEKILTDLNTDKAMLTIGRGSNSDIRIFNQNISRSHLGLRMNEEQIHISNLSDNNWTILNDFKIPSKQWVALSSKHAIKLPGEITISVTSDENSTDLTDRQKTSSLNFEDGLGLNLELDKKKKKIRTSQPIPIIVEKSGGLGRSILILIAVMAIVVFFNKENFLNI